MLSVLIFFAVLSVLVIAHELGHYFAARSQGVKADEFGFGFPPRAVGFVRGEDGSWRRVAKSEDTVQGRTIWSINWLPLGGFVRLKGESGEDGHDPNSFLSKGIGARLLILLAGVAMNWLLAAAIFCVGFGVGVPAQTDDLPPGAIVQDQKVQVTDVLSGSSAANAGIQVGDFLIRVDGQAAKNVEQVRTELSTDAAAGKPISLTLDRNGQTVTVQTTAQYLAELKRPGLGIAMADTGIVRFPWPSAVLQGVLVTVGYTKELFLALGGLISDLLTRFRLTSGVSGPVGIAVITGQIVQQGFWPVMQFTALLSLNLALVNVLPIPALDGGRAVFVLYEMVRRRRANPKFEAALHRIGFILLLALIALVTLHDLSQYGGVIVGGLKKLVGI